MARKKDREVMEFAAVLAKELPKCSSYEIAELAADLITLGRRLSRLAVTHCNVGLTERDERSEERTEQRARELCEHYGLQAVFSGDPRGATLKIVMPSKISNSWGGEGFCVPGS